ncbi:MAG: hypothetical protein E6J56_24845 [Deltaproteobacteria bacterium]|nr:MAG: hypothetical protein E6J56_24845 [Deltaproteobacteria bacterium]
MMQLRFVVLAGALLAAGSAHATTVADCERVVAQFEAHVGRRGLAGREAPTVLRKLAAAAAPRASMSDRLRELREVRDRARVRPDVSRFDADRLARGAEVALLCLQRVREGR